MLLKMCAMLILTGTSMAYAQHGGGGPRDLPPEVREAFKACETENNLTPPEPGQRPSDADRAKMDACLTAKGFAPPKGHRPPPPPSDSSGDSDSDGGGMR